MNPVKYHRFVSIAGSVNGRNGRQLKEAAEIVQMLEIINIPITGQIGAAKLIAMVDNCTTVFSLLVSVGCSLAVTCVPSKYLTSVLYKR